MTRTLILPALLCAGILSSQAAFAQAPDPDALRRGFHGNRLDGQIQDMERRSYGGNLDAQGRRELMERRTERQDLTRPPNATQPGPYRDPVTGGVLLQTPSNPSLQR